MTSRFYQRAARTVQPRLLHEFGVTVTVDPAGASREITAMVEYSPPIVADELGNVYLDDWVLRFADDSTLGIAFGDIVRGRTQIAIPAEAGGSGGTKTKTIIQVESRANGFIQVRTR